MAGVEGGVEAGHLQQVRHGFAHGADRGQVMRLVQRRQRHQRLQFRDHVVVDAHGLREVGAAMHHAMADRHRRIVAQPDAEHQPHQPEGGVVVGHLRLREGLVGDHAAVGHARGQARRHADAFDLAVRAQHRVDVGIAVRGFRYGIDRDLDAGRAGVDDEDDGMHGRLDGGHAGSTPGL
ncbi:hypothetical protein D9M72_401560 [compost metagenome]